MSTEILPSPPDIPEKEDTEKENSPDDLESLFQDDDSVFLSLQQDLTNDLQNTKKKLLQQQSQLDKTLTRKKQNRSELTNKLTKMKERLFSVRKHLLKQKDLNSLVSVNETLNKKRTEFQKLVLETKNEQNTVNQLLKSIEASDKQVFQWEQFSKQIQADASVKQRLESRTAELFTSKQQIIQAKKTIRDQLFAEKTQLILQANERIVAIKKSQEIHEDIVYQVCQLKSALEQNEIKKKQLTKRLDNARLTLDGQTVNLENLEEKQLQIAVKIQVEEQATLDKMKIGEKSQKEIERLEKEQNNLLVQLTVIRSNIREIGAKSINIQKEITLQRNQLREDQLSLDNKLKSLSLQRAEVKQLETAYNDLKIQIEDKRQQILIPIQGLQNLNRDRLRQLELGKDDDASFIQLQGTDASKIFQERLNAENQLSNLARSLAQVKLSIAKEKEQISYLDHYKNNVLLVKDMLIQERLNKIEKENHRIQSLTDLNRNTIEKLKQEWITVSEHLKNSSPNLSTLGQIKLAKELNSELTLKRNKLLKTWKIQRENIQQVTAKMDSLESDIQLSTKRLMIANDKYNLANSKFEIAQTRKKHIENKIADMVVRLDRIKLDLKAVLEQNSTPEVKKNHSDIIETLENRLQKQISKKTDYKIREAALVQEIQDMKSKIQSRTKENKSIEEKIEIELTNSIGSDCALKIEQTEKNIAQLKKNNNKIEEMQYKIKQTTILIKKKLKQKEQWHRRAEEMAEKYRQREKLAKRQSATGGYDRRKHVLIQLKNVWLQLKDIEISIKDTKRMMRDTMEKRQIIVEKTRMALVRRHICYVLKKIWTNLSTSEFEYLLLPLQSFNKQLESIQKLAHGNHMGPQQKDAVKSKITTQREKMLKKAVKEHNKQCKKWKTIVLKNQKQSGIELLDQLISNGLGTLMMPRIPKQDDEAQVEFEPWNAWKQWTVATKQKELDEFQGLRSLKNFRKQQKNFKSRSIRDSFIWSITTWLVYAHEIIDGVNIT